MAFENYMLRVRTYISILNVDLTIWYPSYSCFLSIIWGYFFFSFSISCKMGCEKNTWLQIFFKKSIRFLYIMVKTLKIILKIFFIIYLVLKKKL